ncbi:MAG: glycosyltransferase family 4 protein [Roseiflexaceae bacterium]
MRILYLHQYFVPPETSGGTRSYEFARRLIAAGHEVCMVTSSAMLPKRYQGATTIFETDIAGIPCVVIPVPYGNEMSFADRIKAFIRFAVLASVEATRRKADVIFATSTPLTIAVPGIVGRVAQRIPLVFEVRDLWPELPIAVGALRNPLARAGASALEWLAYHASAEVVALSPGMADGVVRRGYPRPRVTVIPNSCDLELFDVPAERGQHIRARIAGLAPEDPLIVYTGTFGKINGAAWLCDVAKHLAQYAPRAHVLMVGAGAERDLIRERATELGVFGQNLTIWEPIAKNEMPDLLAAATVATSLFLPIRPMWNNSANKFFDALAAGKPLAINYGGWQADLLKQHQAGIVMPYEHPAQAAEQLAAFVHSPARLAQAAQAARTLARNEFDRNRMAAKLESVLLRATTRH